MTSAAARLALRQLEELAGARPGGLEVLEFRPAGGEEQAVDEIEISLNLSGIVRAPGGAPVRDYERFIIQIGWTFPHIPPTVLVPHRRWAKIAHVQWERQLCLYLAPSVEWRPDDGMRGLIERLLLWVEKAAIDDLDSDDQPLHPPAAYTSAPEIVVVHADLGELVPWSEPAGGPAYLVAMCEWSGARFDVVEWRNPSDLEQATTADGQAAKSAGLVCAATILVDTDLGFEFPRRADVLAARLTEAGVRHEEFIDLLATVACTNGEIADGGPVAPMIVIIGTPQRRLTPGRRVAHLVAWRLDGAGEAIADLLAETKKRRVRAAGPSRAKGRADRMRQLGEPYLRSKILELSKAWLDKAGIDWLRVLENRAEVTVRRDTASSVGWLAGKRVIVLGCGALGAPVAEYCLRADAARVVVVDNSIVTPGILVRQSYTYVDIGRSKARTLAARLKAIRPGADIESWVADVIQRAVEEPAALAGFDLIVDATADAGVRSALETARTAAAGSWPTLVTLLIGHQARRGLVAIARPDASGGGYDVLRRLGLAIRAKHRVAMSAIADDFYPDPPRASTFQPEPGCSAPTFTGSAAEVGALAAALISAALDAITGRGPAQSRLAMSAAAVGLGPTERTEWAGWDNDLLIREQGDDRLQVRISRSAQSEIRAEARRGARVRGRDVETGGMLIGALDEAVGCIFVDAVTGPPSDSRLSNVYFGHGTSGAQQLVAHYVKLSRGASGFVGMWHTHPYGLAAPSHTDEQGMAGLVAPVTEGPTQALMIIVGGADAEWTAWRDGASGAAPPKVFAQLVRRADPSTSAPESPPPGSYHQGGFGQRHQAPTRLRWWRRLLRAILAGRR